MNASDSEVREQHHFHGCETCGNIWDHDPPGDEVSREEFNQMHFCRVCGSDRNCDIAAATREEAEELVTQGYITIGGKKYYAADPFYDMMDALINGKAHA